MASSDPKIGGDLFDMAKDGTSIPGDAGLHRTIPSVARPDQTTDDNTVGGPDSASAADNATDIPRGPADMGSTGEVVTGTGDQLPSEVESKRLHLGANNPLAKGSQRYEKHTKETRSEEERFGGEGAEVVPAPGEEEEEQDVIRERKGA